MLITFLILLDIQLFLFSAVGILMCEEPTSYALLQSLRGYLNLIMYAGLSVQSEEHIELGQAEIPQYHRLLQVWMDCLLR